jgi:hypothetical protein
VYGIRVKLSLVTPMAVAYKARRGGIDANILEQAIELKHLSLCTSGPLLKRAKGLTGA